MLIVLLPLTLFASASVVAPGELLPVAVNLTNASDGEEVGVVITYQITDKSNRVVFEENERVVVGKTKNYLKYLQLPSDLPAGRYTLSSTVTYQGQKIVARSQFPFSVDQKIAGVFVRQLLIYGILGVLGILLLAIIRGLIFQRRRTMP